MKQLDYLLNMGSRIDFIEAWSLLNITVTFLLLHTFY